MEGGHFASSARSTSNRLTFRGSLSACTAVHSLMVSVVDARRGRWVVSARDSDLARADPVPAGSASGLALNGDRALDRLRELAATGRSAVADHGAAGRGACDDRYVGREMQQRQTNAGGLLRSALGKARGQALRLALVFEMLWWCCEDGMAAPPAQISARAFAAAATPLPTTSPRWPSGFTEMPPLPSANAARRHWPAGYLAKDRKKSTCAACSGRYGCRAFARDKLAPLPMRWSKPTGSAHQRRAMSSASVDGSPIPSISGCGRQRLFAVQGACCLFRWPDTGCNGTLWRRTPHSVAECRQCHDRP